MGNPAIRIEITQHALWRASQRFPGLDLRTIDPEIREAFRMRRVSPRKPPGVLNPDDPGHLYAWTADGYRVYVLTEHANGECFTVKTTLKTTLAPDWKRDGRLNVIRTSATPGFWGKQHG